MNLTVKSLLFQICSLSMDASVSIFPPLLEMVPCLTHQMGSPMTTRELFGISLDQATMNCLSHCPLFGCKSAEHQFPGQRVQQMRGRIIKGGRELCVKSGRDACRIKGRRAGEVFFSRSHLSNEEMVACCHWAAERHRNGCRLSSIS